MKVIEVDGAIENIVEILKENGIKCKVINHEHDSEKHIITHPSFLHQKIKLLDEQLKELRKNYETITKRVRGYLKINIPSGEYALVDKFLEELSGFSIVEWQRKPNFIQTIIHPEFKDYYKKFFEQLNKGDVQNMLEYKIIQKNGDTRWWLQFNLGAYDAKGNLVSISSIIIDNTEKKDTEVKYRNLFENLNAGVFRTNIETGEFLEVNQKLAFGAGYDSVDEFKKKTKALDFYYDSKDREKIISTLLSKGKITDYELQMKNKDGTTKWVSHSACLYPKEGYCEGIIIDISERKLAEEKLKQNEARLRSIVEQSVAGILIIKDGKIEYANKVISDYSGFPLEFLQSLDPNAFLDLVHPDDRKLIKKMLLLTEQENTTPEFYTRIITKSGEIKWLSIQFKKLIIENSKSIAAVIVEVTKRVELEEKLLQKYNYTL
ncbi:MAG: PAS domain S-box protein [Asgard group archaeon]|nr:PAS domain S-box protein [Asgard group archaeon]